MAKFTDFYNENKKIILVIGILGLIAFTVFIFYINIDEAKEKEFIFYKNECFNGTDSNILIGADFGKGLGELSLTYYSLNNYDLSNLGDMGGLGFDLELPKNEIKENLTFNYPNDLILTDCPNFTEHCVCYNLKENICNLKEINMSMGEWVNKFETTDFSEDWMLNNCKYGHLGDSREWWYECEDVIVEVRK